MKSLLIFNYLLLTLSVLYFLTLHLVMPGKRGSNLYFILFTSLSTIEAALILIINVQPSLSAGYYLNKAVILIPVPLFISLLFIVLLTPAERTRDFKIISAAAVLILIAASMSIITTGRDNVQTSLGSIIHLIILATVISSVIAAICIKIKNSPFSRLKAALKGYLYGLLFALIASLVFYFTGIHFYKIGFFQNAFIPLPFFLTVLFTHHLVYRARDYDFNKFYIFTILSVFALALFLFPIYLFLLYSVRFIPVPQIAIYVKSAVIFLYLTAAYKLINPFVIRLQGRKLQQLLHSINKTLLPADEHKKQSPMDSFWGSITGDNFTNFKEALGIESAYFLLINRKEDIYQMTYGYGPELIPSSIPSSSEIAEFIVSADGVFEKSFLISETPLKNVNPRVLEFFNANGIEITMAFRNMSQNIIGFLLLGGLEREKTYTSDHLAALEIFRIKIQNLLITDLILDEVTAEQVAEHDKIVLSTVKKRIIPSEISSIPGIRISTFYLDNSSYGGDYFDSVKISNDKTILFIAETSYSGIDSALIGMELYSILHSRTLVFNSPEKVLNTMNQVIKTSRITDSIARCSCIMVSSDGNFVYSNASHNPLLILDPDSREYTVFETENIPIGIEMGYRYSFTSGRLKDGAIGIIYSDGLLSSCNRQGSPFTIELLKETTRKFLKESPAVITRELYNAYRDFTGDMEQLNDVAVIVFKRVVPEDEQH